MPNLLSQRAVTALCIKVGFSAADAKIAGAIAMVETPSIHAGVTYSDFSAIGDQDLATEYWGNSYGGFQIRSVRSESGKGTTRDAYQLLDPEFNCRSALAIRKAQGFGAWSTYNSGQYKAYLQDDYPPQPGTYVIVAGDTISKIAKRLSAGLYTWQDLARVNNLSKPYTIHIGQVLVLPWTEHTVQRGETLTGIVAKYSHGVTVEAVAAFNKVVDPSKIRPGQIIRLPRAIYLGGV